MADDSLDADRPAKLARVSTPPSVSKNGNKWRLKGRFIPNAGCSTEEMQACGYVSQAAAEADIPRFVAFYEGFLRGTAGNSNP